MKKHGHPHFLDALVALQEALDAFGVPWALLGGAAVVAHGIPRYTADIDATLLGGQKSLSELVEALGIRGIGPRIEEVLRFAEENQVLLLVHEQSEVPIDLSLAWLPFEEQAVRGSCPTQFATVTVPVVRPEDLLIYKLIASRPKDLEDAERLMLTHRASMDLERVRAVLEEVCVALEDSSRLEILDRWTRQSNNT